MLAVANRKMSLRQEAFQAIAIDYELTLVARDQMPVLEGYQMFGDSRARRTDQFREIAMTCGQRQANSFRVGDAEIFAEFEQNQG